LGLPALLISLFDNDKPLMIQKSICNVSIKDYYISN
jgi:hypothetical protein